jgi:hypothetical protein
MFRLARWNGRGQSRTVPPELPRYSETQTIRPCSLGFLAREPPPVASGRERNGPKSFRKALDLPSPLLGGGSCDVIRPGSASDGGHRVTGSMTGMIGNVGGRGGMAGGSSGRAGRWLADIASGGVSGERSNPHFGKRDLPSRPGTRRLDGLSRSTVLRAVLVEIREDVLGAIARPEHQRLVVRHIELRPSSAFPFRRLHVTSFGVDLGGCKIKESGTQATIR